MTSGQVQVNVAGEPEVVSTVVTVVRCTMLMLSPDMSSILVCVHDPVVSGVHVITQLPPAWAARGVSGEGWAATDENNANATADAMANMM